MVSHHKSYLRDFVLCLFATFSLLAVDSVFGQQDLFFETLRKNAAANAAANQAKAAAAIRKRLERIEKNRAKSMTLWTEFHGKVTTVTHGDRFKLKLEDGRLVQVNIYGIKTHPDKTKTECKGELKSMLQGKKCSVYSFTSPLNNDSNYHFCKCVSNGVDVASELVKKGMAVLDEGHFRTGQALFEYMDSLGASGPLLSSYISVHNQYKGTLQNATANAGKANLAMPNPTNGANIPAGKAKPLQSKPKVAPVKINSKLLENVPIRYRGKLVSLHCTYIKLDNSHVDNLPSVRINTNGLITSVNKNEKKKWFGLFCKDEAGDDIMGQIFLKKDEYIDQFLAMKTGTPLVIEGVVIELENTDHHGIVVSQVTTGNQ